MKRLLYQYGALFFLIALSACGGSKVLKESEPIVATQPLAAASDQRLSVALDWVIVRDGPGTWSRKAGWDEYLLRVKSESDQPVRIIRLIVVDSLGMPTESVADRKQLVKSSKETARRYKKSGIEVEAGSGRGTMKVAAVTATGAGVGAAMGAGSFVGATSGAIVVGGMVLAPVLAIGGVMRGVNQSKVNGVIKSRQTALPVNLVAGEEIALDMFFPIAPSPKTIELTYSDTDGEHRIVIDTSTALDGLHTVISAE
ncbi:MAG: hypothetical protein KJP08_00660 [Gammaproteobacteria bacterium]|nr:hypothetical protein [Gammaproteobacteria bacterium]NNF50227.1 hypothetical protein [Woeseiaceae bacterium]MBT8093292.1 hypothetical protein [Gammaproteobacteria bacterium]MBT8106098.1 hypothetical protein [Gammaproteobacteria bacterium]NNK26112.1 hypothetical protein [Woeseiaceae bacterium]